MIKKKRIQVLIVDDHTIVWAGLRSMLKEHSDIHIVGESHNGIEAIFFVEHFRPSVVLMNINVPTRNDIEVTAQITKEYPDTRVIGLSENATMESEEAIKRAGAVQLLSKEATVEELYKAICKAVTKPKPAKRPKRAR
ncbi:MAG: response regulator transcription factor [Nitrospira sp.]